MAPQSAATIRKPRADAIRNRERVLEAAKAVFSAGGPEASLEAVAKRAGVGIGTLYRHFPTRESLFEAVYRHEVDGLADLAERLLQESPPVDALRKWLRAIVQPVQCQRLVGKRPEYAHDAAPDRSQFSRFVRLIHRHRPSLLKVGRPTCNLRVARPLL